MTAQEAFHPPGKYRLSAADYLTLANAGAFEGLRTELIEGDVIVMSPQHRPHGFIKDELAYRLRRKLEEMASGWHVATEQSVALEPHSEPQPDIILTSEPKGAGPIPAETVALIVEVADSSLEFDLGEKARVYASAAVREYWVADVNGRQLLQFWSPAGDGYGERHEVAFGGTATAATIDGLTIDLIIG